MGSTVIPEQVKYFCDRCKCGLTARNHDHFTVLRHITAHDYSGAAVGGATKAYELCQDCNTYLDAWIEGK